MEYDKGQARGCLVAVVAGVVLENGLDILDAEGEVALSRTVVLCVVAVTEEDGFEVTAENVALD